MLDPLSKKFNCCSGVVSFTLFSFVFVLPAPSDAGFVPETLTIPSEALPVPTEPLSVPPLGSTEALPVPFEALPVLSEALPVPFEALPVSSRPS